MAIFVKNQTRHIFGINESKTQKVTIEPMNSAQLKLCEDLAIEMNRCFQNTYNVVSNNPGRFNYVLGVLDIGLALEHAFIKDNETGQYLDPTATIALNKEEHQEALVIKEFTFDELAEFVVSQGEEAYPPDFKTMSKLNISSDVFVTASEYFKSKQSIDNEPSM